MNLPASFGEQVDDAAGSRASPILAKLRTGSPSRPERLPRLNSGEAHSVGCGRASPTGVPSIGGIGTGHGFRGS
jgi:hypothetical protein